MPSIRLLHCLTDGCWGYQARRTKTLRFSASIGWENDRWVIWPIVTKIGGCGKWMFSNHTHQWWKRGGAPARNLEVAVVSVWRLLLRAQIAMDFTGFMTVSLNVFVFFSMSLFKLVILLWFSKHKGQPWTVVCVYERREANSLLADFHCRLNRTLTLVLVHKAAVVVTIHLFYWNSFILLEKNVVQWIVTVFNVQVYFSEMYYNILLQYNSKMHTHTL